MTSRRQFLVAGAAASIFTPGNVRAAKTSGGHSECEGHSRCWRDGTRCAVCRRGQP